MKTESLKPVMQIVFVDPPLVQAFVLPELAHSQSLWPKEVLELSKRAFRGLSKITALSKMCKVTHSS